MKLENQKFIYFSFYFYAILLFSSCITDNEKKIANQNGMQVVKNYAKQDIKRLISQIENREDLNKYPLLLDLCFRIYNNLDENIEVDQIKQLILSNLKKENFLKEIGENNQNEKVFTFKSSFLQEDIDDFTAVKKINDLLVYFYYHDKFLCGIENPKLELLHSDTLTLLPNKTYRFPIVLFSSSEVSVFQDYGSKREIQIKTKNKEAKSYSDTLKYILHNPLTKEKIEITKHVFIKLKK